MYDEQFDYCGMKIGAMYGNRGIILIKTGAGGNIYGRENKYCNIAQYARRTHGFASFVLTTSITENAKLEIQHAMIIAEQYQKKLRRDVPVYFLGMSKGGQEGAAYLWQYPSVRKILLVNMPIMINWHRSRAGIEKFQGEVLTAVYGSEDPSYRYKEIFRIFDDSRVHLYVDVGKNHSYRGAEEALIGLTEKFLFGS